MATAPIIDRRGRPLRTLRLSVTDRCNLRCRYCMPEATYAWLPREDLLSVDEMMRLVDVMTGLGVVEVHLTGGEPLLRRDVEQLVERIAATASIEDLALTTNGVLLAGRAHALRAAGLRRVTISLDTLQAERFRQLSQRDEHAHVLTAFDAAAEAGFTGTKIDTVVMRGVNDDELPALLDFARRVGAEVRFIEYMDVGGATRWNSLSVVSQDEMLERIERTHGPATPLPGRGAAPAQRFTLEDGSTFGIIASTTKPFCASCDRGRLTADGLWYQCLYAVDGIDLRASMRNGATDEELRTVLTSRWQARDDQAAVDRHAASHRTPIPVRILRRDPHLEMHTRGG